MKHIKIRTRTFLQGGIHPPENKSVTYEHSIENLPLPKKAIIPLSQHLGKPALPVVKKGDTVSEGQLIGKKDGNYSSHVHSSITGKVTDIGPYYTASNVKSNCIVIQLEGEIKRMNADKPDWSNLSREQILQRISEAGVVGMGGAAFPTDVKLNVPSDKKVDFFIVNGAECEPYLTCDYRLMMEKPEEIVEGIQIIKKLLNVKKVFFGVELNKRPALEHIAEHLREKDNIELIALKVKYPQGGEKQLIKAILNKEVPSGGLPFDVGAVVSNVATINAVRDAVLFQKPVIERVVTVTGRIVKNPGNYKIRIGTPLSDVIADTGLTEEPAKIILGGPMMGPSVVSLDTPVTKGTSGILFLSEKEEKRVRYNAYRSCIHCAKCLMVCPVSLNPCMLSLQGEFETYDQMTRYDIMDCIECGCCNYVCPSFRPIVQFIKLGKSFLKKKG
ncbi:MAG: electron transport complex subunit RsxC [bacterium]|nr:electron transport complex subunit RsxC [bacterium]